MKNPTNRDLFAYWNERRGQRVAPERGDIEPNAIRHVLGDSFFLASDPSNNFPFRLAGTRLCALFGRELKNDSFMSLWSKSNQTTIRQLVAAVVEEQIGVVAQATGRTADGAPLIVNLELLLLPLLQRGPFDARVLGALVPNTVPYWFGARVLGPLDLGVLRHVGPDVDQETAPRLVPGSKPISTTTSTPIMAPKPASVAPLQCPQAPGGSLIANGGRLKHGFVVYEGGRTD